MMMCDAAAAATAAAAAAAASAAAAAAAHEQPSKQLRRMAIEAVALLQAGPHLQPQIYNHKPLTYNRTGLLSEAVEAASSVISSNPHLAIMWTSRTINP
jgi:hypothetical protein